MNGLLHRFLGRAIKAGSLEIVDPDGDITSTATAPATPVRVRFTSDRAVRNVVRNPDLKLGEEFVDGGFVDRSGHGLRFSSS